MFFTIITENFVAQVKARSIQHLTQSAHAVGLVLLGIHAVKD